MLSTIWFSYLYQPLFNALIYIYSNIADQNLGWAVVWLTIFLRILLLPLTIISERNAIREEKAILETEAASATYKHDKILQKEEMRKVMKKYRISPWAKVFALAIQLLVLVLLYQVFVRGITGEKMAKMLYPIIDFPGKLNTNFYGFEIGNPHDSIWAGICALYLFFEIMIENRAKKVWHSGQAAFVFVFPLFIFGALWILPMVKSLFILTSMVFSSIISLMRKVFFPVKAEKH